MHCDNSKKRKYCYQQYTLFINGGPLGAGIRRELPICILNKVRGLFPNEDGNPYMGFRHTWKLMNELFGKKIEHIYLEEY